MDERVGEDGLNEAYWRAARRRASWGSIAGGLLVLTLISGALAWSATVSTPSTEETGSAGRTVTDGAGSEPTSSIEPTGSAEPTSSDVTTTTATTVDGGSTPAPAQASVIAYRREGWLCVVPEEGTTETRVVESQSGRFSLSPDGTTIAWVDDGADLLKLVTVAGGRTLTVGPASVGLPSWAPDSTWLVYSGPGPAVRRVNRDGTADAQLFEGVMPAVSTDGQTVVAASDVGKPAEILVWRAGALSRIAVAEAVSGLACDGRTIYYGLGAPPSGTASLHAVGTDGLSDRVLVAAPGTSIATALTDFMLSPDTTHLAYAEAGDDRYSRVFVLSVGGGTPQALSLRRDTYLLRWSASGATEYLIEGNAYQGEPTALIVVRTDGTGRRLVVDGATR